MIIVLCAAKRLVVRQSHAHAHATLVNTRHERGSVQKGTCARTREQTVVKLQLPLCAPATLMRLPVMSPAGFRLRLPGCLISWQLEAAAAAAAPPSAISQSRTAGPPLEAVKLLNERSRLLRSVAFDA